jgi:hypothetical protein
MILDSTAGSSVNSSRLSNSAGNCSTRDTYYRSTLHQITTQAKRKKPGVKAKSLGSQANLKAGETNEVDVYVRIPRGGVVKLESADVGTGSL